MIKSNSIFEAMGNIDDEIAANAIKTAEQSKHKRPLRITMVAAASLAAALAIAVGIRNWGGIIGNYISPADSPVKQGGASYEAPDFGESEMPSPNNSADDQNGEFTLDADCNYRFNVYPHDIVIPDSFKPDETEISHYFRDLKMSPIDLFAEFGIHPLMNDNFTDVIEGEPMWITDDGGPNVIVSQVHIEFFYYLYNKNINKNVFFHTTYHTDDIGGAYANAGDSKVICLKDGSVGLISQDRAIFAYDGVMYHVDICGTLSDGNDNIMDVLADLGVL